jgi:anthranilate/para-aminobenzoate synthase component I
MYLLGAVPTLSLDQLLGFAARLAPPFILLEDGRGEGRVHLAWGARRRVQVPWGGILPDLDAVVAQGGTLYGVIAYDAGLPPTVSRGAPPVEQPLVDLIEPLNRVVLDMRTGNVETDGSDAKRVFDLGAGPPGSFGETRSGTTPSVHRSFDQRGFEAAVERARDYIAAGDIFQANLAVAEVWSDVGSGPWEAYHRLRELNPSPWMGYADLGDWQLVCGSPELLVEIRREPEAGSRLIRTRPIAGTRKKIGDHAADTRMRAELRLDEKERAEHRMLVDLERNDVGRVSEFGSVAVVEQETVEEYSHVFHLVSEVRGRLRRDAGPAAVVAAMFPGGTITGCPKIRAMEIINELEPVGRGAYTGALGWIGRDALQLNIVIRSAVVSGGRVAIQAGAGIVADSIPEREWKEALRKGEAVREAFGVGRQPGAGSREP